MNCALNEIAAKSKENPINPITSPHRREQLLPTTAILFCSSLSTSHSGWWERSISKKWSQPSENQQILDKCVSQVVFAFVDLYCIVALRQVSHSVARIMASVAMGKKIWSLSWCLQLEPWGLLGELASISATVEAQHHWWEGRTLILFLRWTMQQWIYLVCSQGMLYCFNLLIKTSDEWLWWWIRKLNGSRLRGLLGGKRHNCKSPSHS